jgi:hypothetical protein
MNLTILLLLVLFSSIAWLIFSLSKISSQLNRTSTHVFWPELTTIVAIVCVSAIALPWLFTEVIFGVNFPDKGNEIGDAIGGITAPFIGGLSALLVYSAFKEQVNSSNRLIQEKKFEIINENIKRLENDVFDIHRLRLRCEHDLSKKEYQSENIGYVIALIEELKLTLNLLDELTLNREILSNRFYMIYKIKYETHLKSINGKVLELGLINGISFILGKPLDFNTSFSSITNRLKQFER